MASTVHPLERAKYSACFSKRASSPALLPLAPAVCVSTRPSSPPISAPVGMWSGPRCRTLQWPPLSPCWALQGPRGRLDEDAGSVAASLQPEWNGTVKAGGIEKVDNRERIRNAELGRKGTCPGTRTTEASRPFRGGGNVLATPFLQAVLSVARPARLPTRL
ncbi:hypothetical protein M432DRAFT_8685 [Thermoascus aurantiacus ATCC 26904]